MGSKNILEKTKIWSASEGDVVHLLRLEGHSVLQAPWIQTSIVANCTGWKQKPMKNIWNCSIRRVSSSIRTISDFTSLFRLGNNFYSLAGICYTWHTHIILHLQITISLPKKFSPRQTSILCKPLKTTHISSSLKDGKLWWWWYYEAASYVKKWNK